MYRRLHTQNGIAALLYVVMLSMLVVLAIGLVGKKLGIESKSTADQHRLKEMEQIKNRLKLFAMMSAELYLSDTTGSVASVNKEVAPGYLPCPADSSGIVVGACGSPRQLNPLNKTTGFAFRTLPYGIGVRHFYFSNNWAQYYYAVDERFVTNN